VAKCEDLKLKGSSASERGDQRGHERCEQWPARESKEERQLLIYQEDRSLREPQSGFEIHSVTHSTTCMGGKPGILRMVTVHER